jgi:glycogen debranching enzyme
VTLVAGASFCVSSPTGDLVGGSDGAYVRDLRLLSTLDLRVNGTSLGSLSHHLDGPASATFVSRVPQASPEADTTLVIVRHRDVGHGLRDDVTVHNLAEEPTYCEISVTVATDLADPDEVHRGTALRGPEIDVITSTDSITFVRGRGGARSGCRVSWTGSPAVSSDGIRYETILPARGTWSFGLQVGAILDGEELEPQHRLGEALERAEPADRLDRWRQSVPIVATDHAGLAAAVATGADDLGALRVIDDEFPERAVVASGAPWYLGVVGRDALLAAWMALVVDPDLALGTLETLARFQGREVDPRTEEEPGRVPHRIRLGPSGFGPGGGVVSYGSVDASPLFVMLLGELRRWGLGPEVVERLLVHADRALEWIETHGDRDGDGYVEYQRATDRGAAHQGWKDTAGGVRDADGRLATPPIALAEVQGYVYAAYLARAHFATEAGDAAVAERFRRRAAELKHAFNRDFWLDDVGFVALALDRDKRPVNALTSNVGHCLWTGVLDEDKAAVVAKQLMSSELFSGWGIRTLAVSSRGYNPIGAHTGAIWPHDNAICAAGLMRYGFVDEAHRVISGMLDTAGSTGGRFDGAGATNGRLGVVCGFDRDDLPGPVAFPEVCRTRAWSAAAPLLFLRTILRLDPWIPYGRLWLSPALLPGSTRLRVENIPLLGGGITVEVEGNDVDVDGLPDDVELVREPRRPLTGAVPD